MTTASNGGVLRIALVGARGRLGTCIDACVEASDDVEITARIGRAHADPERASDGSSAPFDVVVEVAGAGGAGRAAQLAIAHKTPLVAAGTGILDEDEALRREAAQSVAVLVAPNTSLGILLLRRALAAVVHGMPGDWTIDLVEAHHVHKRDRPSGTARLLAETARSAGRSIDDVRMHVLRAGGIPGDHEIVIAGPDETLRLRHEAGSRMLFAQGALLGARWIADRGPGVYSMDDVVPVTEGSS